MAVRVSKSPPSHPFRSGIEQVFEVFNFPPIKGGTNESDPLHRRNPAISDRCWHVISAERINRGSGHLPEAIFVD